MNVQIPAGREIDAIARRPLWEVGLQYRHGTGHGIGMFLSVHEGMLVTQCTQGYVSNSMYTRVRK